MGWPESKICEWACLKSFFSQQLVFHSQTSQQDFQILDFGLGAVWCRQVQCRCAQFAALVLGLLVSSTCLLSAGLGSRCWFRSS